MPITLEELLEDAEVFDDGDWVESKDQDPDGDVRLTQLADIGVGCWINKSSRYMTTDKADELGCTYLKKGDLLVARMPDPIGRCCEYPGGPTPAVTVVDVCIIRPNPNKVAPRYLMHVLNAPVFYHQIQQNVTGTTRQRISRGNLKTLSVPLPFKNGKPDLDEQKRIAALLDKADAIRRKRQEALRLTDDFLRSSFLDMFGDLRTNSKGWPMRPLAEGVAEFEGGRNFNPTDTPRSDGFKVLKVSAVTSGEYAANESKHFGETDEVPAHYLVRPDDLLISRANTAELVGAVAYVWETQGTEVLPDKLWRFVWQQQPTLEPLFMLQLARSPYFRDQLIQRATGSSGSMKNIGKAKMLEIPVPYPPYTLQQRFSDIAKQVQKTARCSARASQNAETLFSALQQRAFSGEL